MQESTAPRLAKWPFFLGNALLLALAWFISFQGKTRLTGWEALACVICVGVGAAFSIWPYILEYRSSDKLLETAALTSVVSQVQNIEQLAAQISGATAQWQTVQESAGKTAQQAKEISQSMATEAKAFTNFLQQSNDSEKATLRLEVDKLRRGEADWLQALVRILDHVYALNRAAAQSRQQNVIDQLGRFQNACHDTVRRLGLVPFAAAPEEKFDEQRHQVMEGTAKPEEGAIIDETLACGYGFQGRLLRPAIVRIRTEIIPPTVAAPTEEPETETATATQPAEGELPLS